MLNYIYIIYVYASYVFYLSVRFNKDMIMFARRSSFFNSPPLSSTAPSSVNIKYPIKSVIFSNETMISVDARFDSALCLSTFIYIGICDTWKLHSAAAVMNILLIIIKFAFIYVDVFSIYEYM